MKNYTEILKKCIKVAEDRQNHYGEASKSIGLASKILEETFGIKLTIEEICKVIISLKLSRERNLSKSDNLFDIINYLAIILWQNNKP